MLKNFELFIFFILSMIIVLLTVGGVFAATTPPLTITSTSYIITINNKSNATIHNEYVKPLESHVKALSANNYSLINNELKNKNIHKIPVWERSAASDYDDRIIFSQLFENFSMPFFEIQQQRVTNSNNNNNNANNIRDSSLSRSTASGVTFLISSNGFITPSIQGNLCMDGTATNNYFCTDFYFPSERRSANVEHDLIPLIALLSYDLNPLASPSAAPISVFLVGECVDDILDPQKQHFTTNSSNCESIVVDFDQVPEFNVNASNSKLKAQIQLFRNGTVIFRYLSLPFISPVPWWFSPAQIDKVHPSCGMMNNNVEQVANASAYCREATPGISSSNSNSNFGTPLYNEMIFTPRKMEPQICDEKTNCEDCTAANSCTWCEGALPHIASSSVSTGRCIPSHLAKSVCAGLDHLTVSSPTTTTSSSTSTSSSTLTCKSLPKQYAQRQDPYRTVWYANDVGATLEEWRWGIWSSSSSSNTTTSSSSSQQQQQHSGGMSIGNITKLPKWNRNIDKDLYNNPLNNNNLFRYSVLKADHSKPASQGPEQSIFQLSGNQFLPSLWWEQIPISRGCYASANSPVIRCRNVATIPLTINIYSPQGFVRPDQVSVIEVPPFEFQQISSQKPHPFCIIRKCSDLISSSSLSSSRKTICSNINNYRCDSFSLITWRGQILPATNGTFNFTLGVTISEFGHILASLELMSPFGEIDVPIMLPKDTQHFYMDWSVRSFPKSRFSAPMRRFAGNGITAVFAPVTTCPACPIDSSCNVDLGSCYCGLHYDPKSLCQNCLPGLIQQRVSIYSSSSSSSPSSSTSTSVSSTATRCLPCPPCQNGGICDNTTGFRCQCPKYIEGALCEINCRHVLGLSSNEIPQPLSSTETYACQNCAKHSHYKSTCVCGKCITSHYFASLSSSATPPDNPKRREVTTWTNLLGWILVISCIFFCFFFLFKFFDYWYGKDSDSASHNNSVIRARRRRRRRRQRRATRRRAMNNNNVVGFSSSSDDSSLSSDGDYSDDSHDDGSSSDEELFEIEFDENGIAMVSSQRRNNNQHHDQSSSSTPSDGRRSLTLSLANTRGPRIDDILRTLPPKQREQLLLPMMNANIGGTGMMEQKWKERYEQAKRDNQQRSNPLGIDVAFASSSSSSSKNNNQQKEKEEREKLRQQQQRRFNDSSSSSSNSGSNSGSESGDDLFSTAGPKNQNKNQNNNNFVHSNQKGGYVPPPVFSPNNKNNNKNTNNKQGGSKEEDDEDENFLPPPPLVVSSSSTSNYQNTNNNLSSDEEDHLPPLPPIAVNPTTSSSSSSSKRKQKTKNRKRSHHNNNGKDFDDDFDDENKKNSSVELHEKEETPSGIVIEEEAKTGLRVVKAQAPSSSSYGNNNTNQEESAAAASSSSGATAAAAAKAVHVSSGRVVQANPLGGGGGDSSVKKGEIIHQAQLL